MTTQEKIREILKFLLPILNGINVEYWVDCGTLLGIIREEDILEWDNDGDISYLHSVEAYKELTCHLFWVCDHSGQFVLKGANRRPRVYYSSDLINEPWVDFYGWIDGEGSRYTSDEAGFLKNIWPYKSHIGQCKMVVWQDVETMVPEFPEQRLSQLYGKWAIPRKKVPYW
ncbi:hypothetical protein LCGC14_2285710 [marine sediment metagenome]|uniref:LicD/FKTN/FKRP nucleotidyltransferase domain-containing protein n=1 Tax=marine sediment metagenome TaxID=412755 RepID=A0A0F9CT74_9ZZZZ